MTLNRHYTTMLFIAGILLINNRVHAQMFPGYQNSHFAGVHGISSNPAAAAGTRYKWDVNIIGLDIKAGNTYMSIPKSTIFDPPAKLVRDVDYFYDTAATRKQFGWASVDVMLPSVLYSINTEASVAFTWRIRAMANAGNVHTPTANLLADNFPENPQYYNRTIAEEYGSAQGHAWNEFGFTYARTIQDDYNGRWKAGVTLKFLSGLAAAYATGRDGSARLINRNYADLEGEVHYGYNRDLEGIDGNWQNAYRLFANPGVGVDIGVIYEWRPNSDGFGSQYDDDENVWNPDADDYLARFGVSITDIGGISYNKSDNSKDLDVTRKNFPLDLIRKRSSENYSQYLTRTSAYFDEIPSKDKFYMNLPTSLNLMADLKLYPRFYVAANATIALNGAQQDDHKTYSLTQLQITPRFDAKWLGAYLPIQVNRFGQADAGLALRAGPLVIGSASIFSNLFRKELNHADAFVALRVIPLNFGKGNGLGSLFRKKLRPQIDCPPLP